MHVWSVSFDFFELFSLKILKIIVEKDATLWLTCRLAGLLDLLSYWLFNCVLYWWSLIEDIFFFVIFCMLFAVCLIVWFEVDFLFNLLGNFLLILFLVKFFEVGHLFWLAHTLSRRALEFFMYTHFNCRLNFLDAIVYMHCFLSNFNWFFNNLLNIVNHFLSLWIS
jgi:hypothetical protein